MALAVHAALMALYVVKNGGDLCALLCVGANRAGLPPYEAVTTSIGPNGYDGQFYYAIARDPWRTHEGEQIDVPAARHARVLYPALCWLVSGGDAGRLIWAMPLINLLALGALAALGSFWALRHGQSAWWGFTAPLALNASLPALHNLTDPLSTLAVLGLLAAWLARARSTSLFALAVLALLGREQNLLVVGILLLAALVRRRPGPALALGAAVLVWVGWVGLLRSWYGAWPFLPGGEVFGWPLAGMAYRWSHPGGNDGFSRRLAVLLVASMAYLAFQIGWAVCLACRDSPRVLVPCMLAAVALALVGGRAIYEDFWSYNRVFVWIPMGIWLTRLRAPGKWFLPALAPSALWPLAAALRYV